MFIETAKERVAYEMEQLKGRYYDLEDFINSNKEYDKLPLAQKILLNTQRDVMDTYIKVLEQRLLYWED